MFSCVRPTGLNACDKIFWVSKKAGITQMDECGVTKMAREYSLNSEPKTPK